LEPKKSNEEPEEVRKIQLTGKSTYIVSLPKKWVTSMDLKVGSQLVVSKQSDTSLLIMPREFFKPKRLGEASIIISQKDDPSTVARKVIALYLVGYSSIRIETKEERITSLQKGFVKDLIRRKLAGTEIVSDSPNEMKIQILLGYAELSVENTVRRMCLLAASMHEDALQSLKHFDERLAQNVIASDDEVDRFSFYLIRQLKAAVQIDKTLKEAGLSNPRDCLGYRIIGKSIERIADHAVNIAENVLLSDRKMDEKVFSKLEEMSSLAMSVFDGATKSLFKKDYMLADEVITKSKIIESMEYETIKFAIEKIEPTNMPNVRIIAESIHRTAQYASDIAEIVLNLNVDQIIDWKSKTM
jgi:phosphate uptake regulator